LIQNKLTIGQIRPLIGHNDCDYLLEKIIKNDLSSRQVEKLVKKVPDKKPKLETKEIDIINLEKELLEITGVNVDIHFDSTKELGHIKLHCKNLTEFNSMIMKIKS